MESLSAFRVLSLSRVSSPLLPSLSRFKFASCTNSTLPSVSIFRIDNQVSSLGLLGLVSSMASLSSVRSALALNYGDFVNSVKDSSSGSGDFSSERLGLPNSDLPNVSLPEFDAGFIAANPLFIIMGLAAVTVSLIAFRASAGPNLSGVVSAVEAYANLSDMGGNSQLLDIRAAEEIKENGQPDLKSLRKKVVQVAYAAEDPAFVDTVLAKYKDSENTVLYILDSSDGRETTAAKLLMQRRFKGVYAIKGGGNAWQESKLPWASPKTTISLNLRDLLGDVGGGSKDTSGVLPAALGVAAAAGAGLIILSEAETALQLVGTAALVQLFSMKFLFAEDRQKTFADFQIFLESKIAYMDIVDELKVIGTKVFPSNDQVNVALNKETIIMENKAQEAESFVSDSVPERVVPELETVKYRTASEEPVTRDGKLAHSLASCVEPVTPEVKFSDGNVVGSKASIIEPFFPDEKSPAVFDDKSAVKKVVSMSSVYLPRSPTPLSPYTQYQGMKPPSSPMSSRIARN